MGPGISKPKLRLKDSELMEFSKISSFNYQEINQLYNFYHAYSMTKVDDGVIDYEEFLIASHLKDSQIAKNIFKLFDTNEDGGINFREFIIGFANFWNDTKEKTILNSFKLLDSSSEKKLKKDHFSKLLKEMVLNYKHC